MTFEEFVSIRTNKPIDFDGIYPNQCMDLMHFYVSDVLGITDKMVLAAPNAYQVYTSFPNIAGATYFERIANGDVNMPIKGDIVVFGQEVGPSGHVCIANGEATIYAFKSFDANWPVGTLPHIQTHNYQGCLGWLRFKGNTAVDYKSMYMDLLKKYEASQAKVNSLQGKIDQCKVILG